MALPDLTGQNIEDTYQRILQVDNGIVLDGTGSLVPIKATTSSFATTASYAHFAVSASHEITFEISSSHSLNSDTAITASFIASIDGGTF